MKKILALILALAMLFTMAACGCKHEFAAADCVNPATCTLCGGTEGEANGHVWMEATCENPETCQNCNLTNGEVLDHEWLPATLYEPKICKLCGSTEGNPVSIIGEIESDVYRNEYFNFSYKLSDGWSFSTPEQLKESNNLSQELSEIDVIEELNSAHSSLKIMEASDGSQTLNIYIQKASSTMEDSKDIYWYLSGLKIAVEQNYWQDIRMELLDVQVVEAEFCGSKINMLKYALKQTNLFGIEMHRVLFVVLNDGYMAEINITCFYDDSVLYSQLENFSALNSSTAQTEPVDLTPPSADDSAAEREETASIDANNMGMYQLTALPGVLSVSDVYNVYSLDNDYTEEMCTQQGIEKSRMDTYLLLCGYDMIVIPEDEPIATPEFSLEVSVKAEKDYGIENYKLLSDAEFKAQADVLVLGFSASFGHDVAYTVYENDTAKYIVFDLEMAGLGSQRRYATIVNGKMVYFIGKANGEPLSSRHDAQMREIIDTLQYE